MRVLTTCIALVCSLSLDGALAQESRRSQIDVHEAGPAGRFMTKAPGSASVKGFDMRVDYDKQRVYVPFGTVLQPGMRVWSRKRAAPGTPDADPSRQVLARIAALKETMPLVFEYASKESIVGSHESDQPARSRRNALTEYCYNSEELLVRNEYGLIVFSSLYCVDPEYVPVNEYGTWTHGAASYWADTCFGAVTSTNNNYYCYGIGLYISGGCSDSYYSMLKSTPQNQVDTYGQRFVGAEEYEYLISFDDYHD